MSDSLRDQLLKAGFKPSPRPQPGPHSRKPMPGKPQVQRPPRKPGEPDLAQAFAMRAKADRAERDAAERETHARAAEKKERKRRLQELLGGKARNRDDAEQVRNFEFANKIRRIYLTPEQLASVNAGEFGVVMHGGRALLVDRATALAARAIAADSVALLVDPGAPAADDGVPDDLMW